MGAPFEDSASTGTFAPTDDGYRAALASNAAEFSGGAYVYRRISGFQWRIEAFVKAPTAGAGDNFGSAVALSSTGAVLAVGEPFEVGASIGAVTVYRRSDLVWSIDALLNQSNPGAFDNFGSALALSADGATLAVGAPEEGSASAGVFARGAEGHQAALDSNAAPGSGGVTVHRRSGPGWRAEAFVKAPEPGGNDVFGTALALSEDGATLAVGAPFEGGSALPQPVGGDSADTGNAVEGSGAVYLY